MVSKLTRWLFVVPLALVVLVLAVANRHAVPLRWNPFDPASAADGVELPLFLVVFATLAIGALIGGFVVWNAQRRFRRAAREEHRKAVKLEDEVQRMKAETSVPLIAGPR